MSREEEKLRHAVNIFAEAMISKLLKKKSEGYGGWAKPEYNQLIKDKLLIHAGRVFAGQAEEADTAALAMFVWWQRTQK